MPEFYDIVTVLAVWRLTRMLRRDHGPLRIFKAIRRYVFWVPNKGDVDGPDYAYPGLTAEAVQCLNCFSVIVALLFWWQLGGSYSAELRWLSYPLALSATTIGLSHLGYILEGQHYRSRNATITGENHLKYLLREQRRNEQ